MTHGDPLATQQQHDVLTPPATQPPTHALLAFKDDAVKWIIVYVIEGRILYRKQVIMGDDVWEMLWDVGGRVL